MANTPKESFGRTRTDRWRLGRAEIAAILGFWTFVALLIAANRLLDPRSPGIDANAVQVALSRGAFEAYLWAAFTPLVFWMCWRFIVERANWPRRVALFLMVGVLTAIFVDVATDVFREYGPRTATHRARGMSIERSVIRLWFLDDFMIYVGVLSAGLAREYFMRYRTRRDEAMRLQAQAARLQAQLAEARLEALRMQVNPHFLFNTLHAISTLVERDPRAVRRMIARLSELLRYTLNAASQQEVPVERELEFVDRYFEIMQVRFQGRLRAEVEASPEVTSALVPNLILQPLVENAIKHGLDTADGSGHIEVSARREGPEIVLSVRDHGLGIEKQPEEGRQGIGLANARARLEHLYGDRQALTLEPASGGGMVAEVRLPFHTGKDLRAEAVPEAEPALNAR